MLFWWLKAVDRADKKGPGASSSCVVWGGGGLKAIDKADKKGCGGFYLMVVVWGG